MKVYIVETMECSYEGYTTISGLFSTLEKAVDYVYNNFCKVVEHECTDALKQFYGFPASEDEIVERDGLFWVVCETSEGSYREYLTEVSISINDMEVL